MTATVSRSDVRRLAREILGERAAVSLRRRLADGHWRARAHDGEVLRLRTTVDVVRRKRSEALVDLALLLGRIEPL